MRRAERVVDVDVGERRELPGERGVVRLLARVEAHVLEHEDLAVDHALDRLLRPPDPRSSSTNADVAADAGAAATRRTGRERVLRVRLALGTPEVAT